MAEGAGGVEVLVVGGGPAGAAAACQLAAAGVSVMVLEKGRFPRDKVCGDGLIPDSLEALRRLALLPRIEAAAHRLEGVRVFSPGGRPFELAAPLLTLRREVLDRSLIEAAVERGSRLEEGVHVEGPVRDRAGAVVGVRARRGGRALELRAPITLLATGASSLMLQRFGVGTRREPSAVALRAYYRAPALDPSALVISFERSILPGYGWAFPVGGGVANVGVGLFASRAGQRPRALGELFQRVLATSPCLREAVAGGEPLGEPKGAPLRCDLAGALPAAPGLLVAGEALGTTYSLSGEGIGKAMETGVLAARAAAETLERGDLPGLGQRYRRLLREEQLQERFDHYRRAQGWLRWPLLAEVVAGGIRRSPALRAQVEGMLRETIPPTLLLSLPGFLRALVAKG